LRPIPPYGFESLLLRSFLGAFDSLVEPHERLPYRDREGFNAAAYVRPGSLLDFIRRFNAKWAELYGWREEDMLWVLLTGEEHPNSTRQQLAYSTGGEDSDL
jgi:hypothetical protein